VANRGIVFCCYIAEEIDNIVMGRTSYVHVPKKHDNVSLNCAIGMDTAEEAHCVMH
jgi:hypothetical protein